MPQQVTGEDAIRHLMSRGTHRQFGYTALFLFLLLYSAAAAAVAGGSLASGALVPMLLMGAAVGRILGLALVDVAALSNWTVPALLASDEWQWVDPGVWRARPSSSSHRAFEIAVPFLLGLPTRKESSRLSNYNDVHRCRYALSRMIIMK